MSSNIPVVTFPTLDAGVRPRIPTVVDEVNVRIVAALVLVIGVTALVTAQYWLYAVLAADFVPRTILGPRGSFLARLAQLLRPFLPAAPRPTAYMPKRFAAGIGAVMTTAATVLWALSLVTGATGLLAGVLGIGVLMAVFPFLEAVFAFCVGCTLYALLARGGVVDADLCIDCVRR